MTPHVSKPLYQLRARAMKRAVALCLASFLTVLPLSAHTARACAFDLIKPERTAIDWIVESDTLVLARPDPGSPFTFRVIDVLVGSNAAPPIPQLVDSATRRKLRVNPDDAVLFARSKTGSWRRVAYVDDAFRGVLQTALSNRDTWRAQMPQSRIEFIDALQDDGTPRHRAIAIGELDKVPYAALRSFDLRIPTQDLIADLWTREGYPYQAIRALLLGLSGSEEARQVVSRVIDRAQGGGQPAHLGAFAAAYIELEGVDGISRLARDILHDPSHSVEQLEQVIMALSVHHALAPRAQKTAIDAAIETLVQERPSAAVLVARQFLLRSDWSQRAVLESVVRKRGLTTTDELMAVTVYLAQARAGTARPKAVRNEG